MDEGEKALLVRIRGRVQGVDREPLESDRVPGDFRVLR